MRRSLPLPQYQHLEIARLTTSVGKTSCRGRRAIPGLTELKWGEFKAMGFGGLDPAGKKLQFDLTESVRTVPLNLGSVVLLMFTYRVAAASGETNDAHLDRFLFPHHRCAQWRDPTVQHPPHEHNLVLAGATSGYHAQVEKDSEVSPTIWMGHRACDGYRGDH